MTSSIQGEVAVLDARTGILRVYQASEGQREATWSARHAGPPRVSLLSPENHEEIKPLLQATAVFAG